MDETLMGDLASLKRPALQKLCKRFGIKANGKVRLVCVVDMLYKVGIKLYRTLI